MAKNNEKADKYRNEGNSFFKDGKIYDALISFNKSLCFSTPNSKQMAFAYANRSLVYFDIKLFSHCLENIKLARDNNYSHPEKLTEREQKCMELMSHQQKDPTMDPFSFLNLSYPANEQIPFIVNCLELCQDEKYGRHLISNRQLMPGDIIAMEELFLKFLCPEGFYKRCIHCFKTNMLNLIPCNGFQSRKTKDDCIYGKIFNIFIQKLLQDSSFQRCIAVRNVKRSPNTITT